MKNITYFIVILVALYVGYVTLLSHQQILVKTSSPAPDTSSTPAIENPPALTKENLVSESITTPASSPPPVTLPKTPPEPKKQLTPENIFYTTQPVSVTLPNGILGINPGTKVTLIKTNGDTLLVTTGEIEFTARQDQLTNDLSLAQKIWKDHTRKQDIIATQQQQERQKNLTLEQQKTQQTALSEQKAQKELSLQRLQAQYNALTQEEKNLQEKIRQANKEEAQESYSRRVLGRITTKSLLATQRPEMQARLELISQEKRQINEQMSQLRRK